MLGHELLIPADRNTVVDDNLIPTGELREVRGNAMDFTAAHLIGERIGQVPGGYDHNYVLNKESQVCNFTPEISWMEPSPEKSSSIPGKLKPSFAN
ncbi:MAG: hypothetical protein FJY10_07200 [Bacteroidetes bacterium]|nr:hypothetical protein [Bacteroidota bacterium]